MISCKLCDQEWERDPALEVACPTCQAGIGQKCKRPSGHEAMGIHADRDRLAMKTLPDYGMCPEGKTAKQKETKNDTIISNTNSNYCFEFMDSSCPHNHSG